ncbi:MAG: 2-C-methyl-D-erythritol 4-phosphate cytidylyltransferase [Clostridia bacterium]|nr:2-C-methyl-D-erythritol 4-phosphate cytidylyltransferase [Clostridia bacterium]
MSLFKTENRSAAKPYVTAVIVAAGNSTRMGGVNKQFLLIDGVPVLIRTLRAFEECENVNEIIIAAREEDIPRMFAMLKDYNVLKVKDIVTGGRTRQQSVFNAIRRSSPLSEYFAIHDGARPLVTAEIINKTLETAFETQAAATGVRVKDTIKIVNTDNVIEATPDRASLWAVHTPQVFNRNLYLTAVDNVINSESFTDDCMLIEEYGHPVTMVEGSYDNIKITTPEDIVIAEAIINRRENDA